MIGKEEIKPEQGKVEILKQVEVSKQKYSLFLGLVAYYQRFIPHFSTIAQSLTHLMRKKEPPKL